MDALIKEEFGPYHRTVPLRHLGAAVGGSGLLSALLFGAGALFVAHDTFVVWVALGGIVVSLLLLALGWIKALQQTAYAVTHEPEAR